MFLNKLSKHQERLFTMEDPKRINQWELILTELIHSNEIAEKRLNRSEQLQYIMFPVLSLIGAGTLFAIIKYRVQA